MITLDLDFFWLAFGAVLTALAGFWGLRRARNLVGR